MNSRASSGTMYGIGVVALVAACGACTAASTDLSRDEEGASSVLAEDVVPPELRERITDEAIRLYEKQHVAELPRGSTAGDVCAMNCAAGYAALCASVSAYCTGATVITIGGTTIPCATAIAATCISSAAIGALCARRCPP